MRLQLADWVFEIHMDATMQYSAAEAAEHCDCAYCRNFYAALDARYPDLRVSAEMERIIPIMKEGGGYVFASDHSIPNSVSFENMTEIAALAHKLGKY